MKDWMQIGVFLFVAGIIAFLVYEHTGTAEGQVEPKIVYTAFVSIFATKIVDFAFFKSKAPKPEKEEKEKK